MQPSLPLKEVALVAHSVYAIPTRGRQGGTKGGPQQGERGASPAREGVKVVLVVWI